MKKRILSLTLASLIALPFIPVSANTGSNIIANGSFEQSAEGWELNGVDLIRSKGGANSTGHCAKVTVKENKGGIYFKNDFLSGESYSISFYAKLSKGSNMISVVQEFDEGGEFCIKKGMYIDEEWRKYSFDWIVPSKNSQGFDVSGAGKLTFRIGSGNEKISYFIDEISVITKKALPRENDEASAPADINGHWAEDYIKIALQNGLLLTDSKENFNPDGKISAAEFVTAVTALYPLSGSEKYASAGDISLKAAEEITEMIEKEHKISVCGSIGLFSEESSAADKSLTRAQAARIVTGILETKNRCFIYADAENGSDENDGTETAPYKSVKAAFEKYAQLQPESKNDIYIYLKAGEYYTDEALKLNSDKLSDNTNHLFVKSYGDGQACISMGVHVSGFTLHDAGKNIYKTYVGKDIKTRQLFINGIRATRARSEGGLSDAVLDKSYGYTSADTFLTAYKNIKDLEFVYSDEWTNPRCGVDSVSVENGRAKIIMKQPGFKYATNKGASSATYPIYYENAYELLDRDGEWYLDTNEGMLYYIPRMFEDINSADAILPIGEEMMILEGTVDKPIKNISFENVCFENTTWMRPSSDHGHTDAQNNILRELGNPDPSQRERLPDTAIMVRNAQNVNFQYCTFRRLGITALQMLGGIRNCSVIGNHFYDISGTAITLGDSDYEVENISNPKDGKYYISNNKISDNYIHNVAVDYKSAAAISAGFPKNTEISHNDIGEAPYSGFHIGFGWSDLKTSAIYNLKISANYLHNIMDSTVFDGAGIYLIGGTGGTEDNPNLVSRNYIENMRNKHGALYPDEGSTFWKMTENVIDYSDVAVHGGKDGSSPASPKWLHIWTWTIHDNQAVNNWSTTPVMYEAGTNNKIEAAHVYPNAEWPKEAREVIDESGLEPEYEKLYPATVQYARLVTKEYAIEKGKQEKIDIKAHGRKNQNYDISGVPVYYKSLNPSIASVDKDGIITGNAVGETKVICYLLTYDKVLIELEADVFVGEKLNSVELNRTSVSVMKDARTMISGKGITNKGRQISLPNAKFTIENPEIAAVDKQGNITGLKNGKTSLNASFTVADVTIEKTIPVSVISYGFEETGSAKGTDISEQISKKTSWEGGEITASGGGVQISTSGSAAYYSKQMFGSELLEFDMKINASGGWPSLVLGAADLEKGIDGTCYLIGFKKDILELQRFNNGVRTAIFADASLNPAGGPGYPNKGTVFEYGKKYHITVGRIMEKDGVRVILNIDGKNIFDYLDSADGYIDCDGYFGVYANSGNIEFTPATGRK